MGVEVFFCCQIFAAKSLKQESMRVYRHIEAEDLPNARRYLSWIVGRDTENPDTLSVSFADKMNAYISQLSDEELAEQFDYYAADVTLTLYEEE